MVTAWRPERLTTPPVRVPPGRCRPGKRTRRPGNFAGRDAAIADYLGEIDWTESPLVKEWYQRIKSRPSFRPLLTERVRGLTPVSHYADLDF